MRKVKFQCLECHKRVYLESRDVNNQLPDDMNQGDAMLFYCPFCDETQYGVLANEDDVTK